MPITPRASCHPNRFTGSVCNKNQHRSYSFSFFTLSEAPTDEGSTSGNGCFYNQCSHNVTATESHGGTRDRRGTSLNPL